MLPHDQEHATPSRLATEIIEYMGVQPNQWGQAYHLAQLLLAMEDFVEVTDKVLSINKDALATKLHLFSLIRLSGNALAACMGDLLWLEDFADTYADIPQSVEASVAEPARFPNDVWDRHFAGFTPDALSQLQRVKSHLADVYEDCSAMSMAFKSFRAHQIGRNALLWGDSGLMQARIHTLHLLVGSPGGFAGLLADMAVLEESLFAEPGPAQSGAQCSP